MNKNSNEILRVPGFTAEASLNDPHGAYSGAAQPPAGGGVVAAISQDMGPWGPIWCTPGVCVLVSDGAHAREVCFPPVCHVGLPPYSGPFP